MCFKIYTYPYFTYISNFLFQPTHKSTQSYHPQPKHNPILLPYPSLPLTLLPSQHPYLIVISIPISSPISHPNHIPIPISHLSPYRSFIVLSISNPIQSYPILPNSTHISLTLTPTLSISPSSPTFTYLYKINVYP